MQPQREPTKQQITITNELTFPPVTPNLLAWKHDDLREKFLLTPQAAYSKQAYVKLVIYRHERMVGVFTGLSLKAERGKVVAVS